MFSEIESENVQGVAGVRRTEVTIDKKDTLYWPKLESASFKEGYIAFQNGDYEKAIDIFEILVSKSRISTQKIWSILFSLDRFSK